MEGASALLAALSWPIISRIPLGGDLAVSPHGIGIAAGFLLGAWMMTTRAQKRGLGRVHVPEIPEAVQQLLGRAALGALLGARGFYVLTHLDVFFPDDPLGVFRVWEGGLTFLGGVVGAMLVALPWGLRQQWDVRMLLDSAMPGIAAGLVVGRIGDLMIGDHIGAPTNFFLGWRCTGDFNPVRAGDYPIPYPFDVPPPPGTDLPTIGCFDTVVHQTALYDFGAALFVLVLLLWLERRPRFDGFFAAAWVYGYGAVRFAGDFARQDRRFLQLTGSQWALLAAAVAVTVWLVRTRPWERRPWAWDRVFAHPWHDPDPEREDPVRGAPPVSEDPDDRPDD